MPAMGLLRPRLLTQLTLSMTCGLGSPQAFFPPLLMSSTAMLASLLKLPVARSHLLVGTW